MNFIDEMSLRRLDFKNLISKVEILSAYGKNKLNSLQNYTSGEEEKLIEEFDVMELVLKFISTKPEDLLAMEILIHKLKDLKNLVKNIDENIVLDTVDLFELKVQLMQMSDINVLLEKNIDCLSVFILNDLSELSKLLDPKDEKIPTFYIYDSYSLVLQEIRKNKREIEKRIFAEKDISELKNLKESRLSILVDEEKEEFKIRKNLTKLIRKYVSDFIENIEKISYLDLVIGKVKFAIKYGGRRPKVIKEKRISLKDAVNIQVREILEMSSKKYTPIDITLDLGTTIITGANMGGKSVALKTITENVILFHLGFFPFVSEAEIPLLDFVFFISDDMQDISKGLSTFGAEIIKLKEIIEYLKQGMGLIVFDEFARGTNPKEGQKFVVALAKYLNSKNSISLITTHFDAVVDKTMNHYQVVGLKKLNFEELKNKILTNNNSMEIIQKYMDFRLEKTDKAEVPKDALNIAKLIGLDEELSEMIYREYTEEEYNE